MIKCKFVLLSGIIFIQTLYLFSGCSRVEEPESVETATESADTGDNAISLSNLVISELESSLKSSTSSRINGSTDPGIQQRDLSTSLHSTQIQSIIQAAKQAVTDSNTENSSDLIVLLPHIIKGSQSKLSTIGLNNSNETVKVIEVIVNSLIKSLKGRSDYLPNSSAETGETATETVLRKITETSFANLDEAGLSSSDVVTASSELLGTVVGSLDLGGISASELGGALDKITLGAVDSLDQISGFEVTSLGDAIYAITGSVTSALGDITVEGFSSDNLTSMVENVVFGATSALGKISIRGFTSDNLSSMVKQVSSGATGALGKISMDNYSTADLPGMVSSVTAGATSALGQISMTGYSSDNLSTMVSNITAGATSALGQISMTAYSSDNLSLMVSKVTEGSVIGLGNIQMKGYTSDNVSSMITNIISSATSSLSNIVMAGFNPDNISSEIKNSITIGSNAGILMQPPMVMEITFVTSPTKNNKPSYTFKSSKAGTISYEGNCRSDNTNAIIGNNTITFNSLSDGVYSNCKLYVISSNGVKGNVLSVTPFTVSSGDSASGTSDGSPIVFCESIMDPDAKWSRDYEESANDIIRTSAGDYVVVGSSLSWEWPPPDNEGDILMIKLDGSGNILWNKKIHLRSFDTGTSVIEDNDGNYVLTGFTSSDNSNKSDVFFGKVDPQGNVLTKKAIRITKNYDGGYSISKTSDGGYIIGGEAGHSHNEDFMMLKVDKDGNKQWSKRFTDQPDNSAYDAIEASDGNFYLIGRKRIVDRYEDIRIIKTNSKGTKIWDKTYGGNKDDIGEGIIESENNTFVVVAGTFSFGKGGDVLLMKINSDGEVIWEKNYGGDKLEKLREYDGNSTSGRHLTKTPDGGFLVSGSKDNKMWVFKTNSSGSLLWDYSGDFGGAFSAREAVDGSVIVTGPGASGGTGDLYVVKIKSDDGSKGNGNITCSDNDNTSTSTWTKQLGSSSGDEGTGVSTDSSGNIYVTGYTGGGLDGNTSSGGKDIFLIKYDSSGTKQWTKQLGTSSGDEGRGITTDSSGNIYVTGLTQGGLDGNTNSGSNSEMWADYDIFLVKYNSSGTKQWTNQLGTSSSACGIDQYKTNCGISAGNGVSTDSSGNIYVTGYTVGGLDGNTSSGYWDIFLTKYNSSGIKLWTKQLGNSGNQHGKDVATDSSGNIYVTGYTAGELDGNTSSGVSDIFLVKYDSSGTKKWTKQLGTSSIDEGTSVTIDSSGNIYVTGLTYNYLDGNTGSGGAGDIFLVKYDSSGTKHWTKQLGTSNKDHGKALTTDSSGNIYVTGYTSGLENYIGLDGNTSLGSKDIFLVKYDSSGTKKWTKQFGTSSSDEGTGVTTDSSGNIYVTGKTSGNLDANTSSGGEDIFLVKFNSDGVKQ